MSRSSHRATRILKVYVEVVLVYSHTHTDLNWVQSCTSPESLNTTFLFYICIFGAASESGGRQAEQWLWRSGDGASGPVVVASVQFEGQWVVRSSWWPPAMLLHFPSPLHTPIHTVFYIWPYFESVKSCTQGIEKDLKITVRETNVTTGFEV